MARKVSIEPMSRIEGHMKVETSVDAGKVTNARISGQMFRGFETFLTGRHPLDAARIAQRVCGVCHEVHGVASVMALEELYGVKPTPNGHLLRDLILGLHLVTDHFLHFYNLSVPDYIDFTKILEYTGNDTQLNEIKAWVTSTQPEFILKRNKGNFVTDTGFCLQVTANYFKALEMRSKGASGIAILGAKAPFIHALLPGGITTEITPDKLMKFHAVLSEIYNFTMSQYIPDVLALAARYPEYFRIGEAHNTFYSNKTFTTTGKPLFDSGIVIDGKKQNFDFSQVTEEIESSYYDASLKPQPDKAGAYTWVKSPRYDGKPMEVGPLARLMVNRDKDFLTALRSLKASDTQSSTMGRHLARAYESKRICEHLFDIIETYAFGEPTIDDVDVTRKVTGKGIGFSIAARGALIHEVEAVDGIITRYNMIVPSTWNFGPKASGVLGVAEQSLINTPVKFDSENSIEVGRVIRSYDPCTACSIH